MTTNKLYPIDIAIYNRIKYFVEQKAGFCYESNSSLSNIINRSVPRISASINKLLTLGYIKNDGTKWNRQLKLTDKTPDYSFSDNTLNKSDNTLNKNDTRFNKSDNIVISEMLISLYKSDKSLLTKTIRDFNKSDNIVRDNIRLELIDLVNELKEKPIKENEGGISMRINNINYDLGMIRSKSSAINFIRNTLQLNEPENKKKIIEKINLIPSSDFSKDIINALVRVKGIIEEVLIGE